MRTDVIALEGELKKRVTLKEQILQMCPELAEDEDALVDTLDGETNVKEILVAMARSVKEREAMMKACKELAKTYRDRADRHERVAANLKSAIIWGLEELGETRIRHAHVSLSMRGLEDKIDVVASDTEMLSDDYVSEKVSKYVDIKKIAAAGLLQEAIEDGVINITSNRKSVTIRI